MFRSTLAFAAIAAMLPATAVFADNSITPGKRPLEQFTQGFNSRPTIKLYGYSGPVAETYGDPSPDKVPFGEGRKHPSFKSHEIQTNYGGDAGSWIDPSPDKRPFGF